MLDDVPTMLAPRYWGVHLLAVVLTAAAVGLGVWQYDAWQARRAAEAQDLTRVEPVGLRSVIGPDDPFPGNRIGQPVILGGTWVPDGTVYVSGREQDGREGYWVVTPLAITGAHDPAIPVVRGWVTDPGRAPAPPTGYGELVGWLQPPEGTGEADADPRDDVLPQLRTADVIQHVDQDLYGAYAVVADRAAPGKWPVGDRATNDGTTGLAARRPRTAARRRPVHRAAQPALRHRVVVLRGLRAVRLGAVDPGRDRPGAGGRHRDPGHVGGGGGGRARRHRCGRPVGWAA